MQLSSLNQNDLPICGLQLSTLLGVKRWESNVFVMHRATLCNQNINILIELMEHLNGNIQLPRPSLGGNPQRAHRV